MVKKIVIFPGYYIPHVGGVETYVDEFAKYLSRHKDYQIFIFAPNIPKYKHFEVRHNNVKVFRYPAFDLIPNYPVPNIIHPHFWKMWKSLYKLEADIVITHTRFFSNSLLGFIFSKLKFGKKPKLLHTEHGSAFVKVQSKITNIIAWIYDKTIGSLIFRKSDCVIAISETVKEFVSKNFRYKDIKVIYRGINFSKYDSIKKDREIFSKFKGKTKFCTVARLFKWKGIENTIKAYKSLPEEFKRKSVLLIVGYGEDLERLKKLAQPYLNRNIFFTGKVPFERAVAITKSCDIFIHSSYPGGGLSTSLLEAMTCGKAIIASPNEGAKEVIFNDKTGILLKDNKPENIREAMLKLLKNKELIKNYGANARKFIKENLNWDTCVEKYIIELDALKNR